MASRRNDRRRVNDAPSLKLKGGRGNSHLPQALDLALARPVVTAELLAKARKVSAQAGQNLIADLGLRELTGRRRYRAWDIL